MLSTAPPRRDATFVADVDDAAATAAAAGVQRNDVRRRVVENHFLFFHALLSRQIKSKSDHISRHFLAERRALTSFFTFVHSTRRWLSDDAVGRAVLSWFRGKLIYFCHSFRNKTSSVTVSASMSSTRAPPVEKNSKPLINKFFWNLKQMLFRKSEFQCFSLLEACYTKQRVTIAGFHLQPLACDAHKITLIAAWKKTQRRINNN